MFDKSFIVALIFCLTSLIYMFIGYYGLSLNIKSRVNRMFFTMTSSLSFWALTYAIVTNTGDLVNAIFWTKISVFGWGTYYGLALHFSKLVSTNREKLSLKEYLYIYIPMIYFVSMVLFDTGLYRYNIVQSEYGFTVSTPFTLFNIAFTVYSLIYTALTINEIYRFYKNTSDKKIKKLIISIFKVALIITCIGVVSEVIIREFFDLPIIQSVVIFLLLPVSMFFYLLLTSKIMHAAIELDIDNIVDDKAKELLFQFFGYIYVLFAYGSFIVNYLDKSRCNEEQLLISFVIMVIAFMHFFLTFLFIDDRVQYNLITSLYIFVISFLALFYTQDFFNTIWLFYFCYLIITVIYKKSWHWLIMYVTMLGLQIFILMTHTDIIISYEQYLDFTARAFMMTIFAVLSYFINRAYRKRINDNIIQMNKQLSLKEFSKDVFAMDIDNLVQTKLAFLYKFNNDFSVKRSYYLEMSVKEENQVEQVLFVEGGKKELQKNLNATIFANHEYLLERLYNDEIIEIFNIDYENKLQELKNKFRDRGINSLYAFPVKIDNKLRAIIACECIFDENNKLIHFYIETLQRLVVDAYKKVDNEKDLFFKANYDAITGLINKSYFMKKTNKILSSLKKKHKNHYCLYIDIDDFKSINDSFGHVIGDRVLLEISNILIESVDGKAFITRFTGDEFVIFFKEEQDKKFIRDYSQAIIDCFKQGIEINDSNFRLNISIGIANYPNDAKDMVELIKNSDLAMHVAKDLGHMKYHFCNDNDKKRILEDAKYIDKLYTALDKEEFVLAYQPQIDIESEKVIGVESLIRWNSSDFGMVSPNKFVHILEKTGLIISVGEWIIEETMREQQRLKDEGINDIRLSINLSAIQFMDTTLVDTIRLLKEKYNVNSEFIEFEITESVAINDSEYMMEAFSSIKEMGFSIAIDDFGTGFSSLNRLQSLPLDRLKIDKSFIDGIGENPKRESIVNVIIELSKNLGLISIAEGVETKEQIDYLRKHQCKEVQGYYYAKPLFADELREFILSKNNYKRVINFNAKSRLSRI